MSNDNDNGNIISFAKRGEVGRKIEPFSVSCMVDERGQVSVSIDGNCSDLEVIGLLECAKVIILQPDDDEAVH